MSIQKIKTLLLMGLLSLPLSACGEGWEAVKTTEHFPYGNQRTAGSGVAYVLAQMLPEKSLNLKKSGADGRDTGAVMSAEDVFEKAQKK